MITPTIGRVVWFYPSPSDATLFPLRALFGHQPMAAHVAVVHNDALVNLMVIDPTGHAHPRGSVILRQEGDAPPENAAAYCEWMPYQKGQAAKTEALEARAGSGG